MSGLEKAQGLIVYMSEYGASLLLCGGRIMKYFFDPLAQKYPSSRYPIYARGGMVNCSSPLAAAAGLDALKKGGNAMDAAAAAAAAQAGGMY